MPRKPRKLSRPQALPERITGPVWGFDLGRRTGWAKGLPGAPPVSGVWELKGDRSEAFGAFMGHLQAAWKDERPALVSAEAALTLAAFMKVSKGNQDVVQVHYGLHAILVGMCSRWNIPFISGHNATYRLHFIGRGRLGERHLTKAAVVNRCHLIGVVPKTCFDEDRCDACAVQDWAAFTYGQRSASVKELFLTGEVYRR